jgi:phage-related protein
MRSGEEGSPRGVRHDASLALRQTTSLANISDLTYVERVADEKPLVWLHGEVKTPPFSRAGRLEAGFLLRRLQRGVQLSLPGSRPMPAIGERCHELRIVDEGATWRILYHVSDDAVVILEVFAKKTRATPKHVLDSAKGRLKKYKRDAEG